MAEMLTAKELEELLQVDRSTIYRMAEQGRLPAIKVGKQWRFPSERVSRLFQIQIPAASEENANSDLSIPEVGDTLTELLPVDCVQLIQDSFADLLGVMVVVTDMEGQPVTKPSNTCGLFEQISRDPDALQKCIQDWGSMATSLELEPHFSRSHLGLNCARALIRVGSQLQGMVVVGCVKPADWPPTPEGVENIASELGVEPEMMDDHLDEVFHLGDRQQEKVLLYTQRIANIVAHIVNERLTLINRLEAIADLTAL